MVKVTGKQVREFVEANGRAAIAKKVTELVAQLNSKIAECSKLLDDNPELVVLYDVGIVCGIRSAGSLDTAFFAGSAEDIKDTFIDLKDHFLEKYKEQNHE